MSWMLLAVLCQGDEFRVRDLGREVKVLAFVKTADVPAVLLRRRTATMKEGSAGKRQIAETWKEESYSLAEGSRDRWKAEVRLLQPGWYDIRIGDVGARVGVSRSGFEGWERQLTDLRSAADRLLAIARKIDGGGVLRGEVLQRELVAERTKLFRSKTDFDASLEALGDGIDRLRFHPALLKAVATSSETDFEYGPASVGRGGPVKSIAAVEGISSFIARELSHKLLGEILLVLADDLASQRVVRWSGRLEVLASATRVCEKAGGVPELAELLKSAPPEEVSPGWELFHKSADALRVRLLE